MRRHPFRLLEVLSGVAGRLVAPVIWLPLVLLATAPARAACEIVRVGESPVSDVLGFVVIPASIDGQRVSLLLDTGAAAGLVRPDAAARLGLPGDPQHVTLLQGTGGDAGWTPHVLIPRLEIGGLMVHGITAPLGGLPALPRVVPAVAGLLGADLLSRFDLEIDLREHRVAFYRVTEGGEPGLCEEAALPPWKGAFDTIPLRRSGDRLLADIEVNGQSMTALIDTGARSLILSTPSAERLGVSPEALARDPGGITGGVDMREVLFHWHRFASLRIGRETIRNPELTVSSLDEEADLLLGSTYFATRRVWLSYATGRMFVQPSSGR